MQTLYETLELSRTAQPEQIKRAYRVPVKRFHPDLFPSGSASQSEAEVRIRQIDAAYGVLSNSGKTVSLRRESNKAEVALRRVKTGIL